MSIKKVKSGYQVDYRNALGKRTRHTKNTLAEAKIFAAEMEVARSGDAPAPLLARQRSLRDLWHDANTFVTVNWKHSSRVHFDHQAMLFVEYCEKRGIFLANQVTKKMALSYVNWVKNIYISPRTHRPFFGRSIDHCIITASTLFRTELDLGEPPCINRNPFKNVELRGSRPKRPPKHISVDHLKAFLEVCPELESHVFALQYSGGLRPNEVRELTWEVVKDERLALGDRDDLELKTDESMKSVPMNELMKQCLAWFRERTGTKRFVIDGSVFCASDGHGNNKPKDSCPTGKTFLREKFSKVRDRARLAYPDFDWNHFTPHKLRGAYGSHLREQGVAMSDISKMMRHKHESTTERWYINTGTHQYKEQAAKIDTLGIRPVAQTLTPLSKPVTSEAPPTRRVRKSVHKVSKPLPRYTGLTPISNTNMAKNLSNSAI